MTSETSHPLPQDDSPAPGHARRNLVATTLLLGVWFVVSFGIGFFARELDFSFFGWPFSFWMGAQGALVVYGLITAGYAGYLNRLDRRFGRSHGQDAP